LIVSGRRVIGRTAKLRCYTGSVEIEFLIFWLRFWLRFGHGCQYTSITTDRTAHRPNHLYP